MHVLRRQKYQKEEMLLLQTVLRTVQFDIPLRSGIVKVLQLNPGGTRAGELIKVAITACNHTAYK